MLRSLFIVALGACRLNFDEVPADDAAPTDDEAPLVTPCNTPVLLAAEAAPAIQLSAAATSSTLVASWLRSDGTLGQAGARRVAGGLEPFAPPLLGGTWTSVALAASGDDVMSALGRDATSQVRFLDEHLGVFELARPVRVRLTGTRGATPLRSGAYPFAIAGASGAQALAPDDFGPELEAIAEPQASSSAVAFDNDFAVISAGGGTCRLIRLRPDSGPIAPLAYWGADCATPIAAHLPGRTDFLLARHHTRGAAIDVTIAALVGGGASIPPERRLATGSHPTAIATRDGYWLASHANGVATARLLDFAGDSLVTIELGPAADGPVHDVVALDDTAYAMWIRPANGLYAARLCR